MGFSLFAAMLQANANFCSCKKQSKELWKGKQIPPCPLASKQNKTEAFLIDAWRTQGSETGIKEHSSISLFAKPLFWKSLVYPGTPPKGITESAALWRLSLGYCQWNRFQPADACVWAVVIGVSFSAPDFLSQAEFPPPPTSPFQAFCLLFMVNVLLARHKLL